jgi:hypothetical protein
MSLHLAAQHLAAKGRGPDDTLVHMSKGEVHSLQALAKANGGSLTTNPETGLPEAGFLSSMLPMVAGAALMATGVGAPMAALMVGGGAAMMSGSLSKGLMAGLGAYGGANLGQSLAEQGVQQAALEQGTAEAAQQGAPASFTDKIGQMGQGVSSLGQPGVASNVWNGLGSTSAKAATVAGLASPLLMQQNQAQAPAPDNSQNPYQYTFDPGRVGPTPVPDVPGYGHQNQNFGKEQRYFNPSFTPLPGGGPVEQMSNNNAIGQNTGYPMADIHQNAYATPYQQPISQNVLSGAQDVSIDPYSGQEKFASGGLSNLGGYSDGGHLLRGPGDGVSDSIPATIGGKQPARLADGEFVVPARIVSELGNGSTEAGARKLYAMMDRVQKARGKTVGKGRIATNTKSDQHLPA